MVPGYPALAGIHSCFGQSGMRVTRNMHLIYLMVHGSDRGTSNKQSLSASQEIEEKKIQPETYPYGSRGPIGSHYLAAKYGVRWGDILSAED